MQVVTELDLEPAGWVCDTCKAPFSVGDQLVNPITDVMADGTPIEADPVCMTCWLAESSG